METRTIIKFHIIFWIVVISISLLDAFTRIESLLFISQLSGTFSILIYNLASFYLFYRIVSQRHSSRKSLALLFLSWILYISISGFLVTYFSYYAFVYFYPPSIQVSITQQDWVMNYVYGVAVSGTVFSILGGLAKIAKIWYSSKIKQMETEKQNLTNELAMLRAQVNPHFLFNTLNNIKSLVKSQPAKAVYSIEKLNRIMNYMLYESSLEKVPLVNEIGYIKNYLELEKIRYTESDFILFTITGDYSGVQVPPLIFMPFIENAFKHGNKLAPAPGVLIKIDILDKNIDFSIRNYVKENNESRSKNSGFGLPNIQRRLDLLFEKNYDLQINTVNREFSVKLNFLLQ